MERGRISSIHASSSLHGGTAQTPQSHQQQTQQPPSTQLRPLPGYSLSQPKLNIPQPGGSSTATISAAAMATAAGAVTTSITAAPTTVNRYKTRERLYYEAETTKDYSHRTTIVAGFPATGTDMDKPSPLLERLAEDAPPTASLRDIGTLTPERKYSSQEDFKSQGSNTTSGAAGGMAIVMEDEPAVASEGNWVTVFGFATSQITTVLEYFRRLGVVETWGAGQGNWFHIKYSTQWAAQKALAKNGSILAPAGSCMIGVIPTQRAMDQVSQASDSFMSPLKREVFRPATETSTTTAPSDIFLRSGILSPRPPAAADSREEIMASAPMAPSSALPKSVRPSQAPSQRQSSSVISQALGYVLGW